MRIGKVLLEKKSTWRNSHDLSLENMEILAAFDKDENCIAIGEAWAYFLDTGIIMAAPCDNHYPPKTKLQKIEVLYLLPGDLKPEEHERILEIEKQAFPLPPAYCAGQILCQNNVFTISSKAGNPSICGTYPIIYQQLFSATHAYYTRGLAVNVLERYYYEFLAERHQLYLDEEMFMQEMKKRKKHKKSLRNAKISEENFSQGKNGEYTCSQKIKLWGITTTLYTEFKEHPKHREWTLGKYIHQLNMYISWMEKHEKDIEKELLKANMVELANYWMEGREVVDENGQTYYELDGGESFPFPITEASFLENLFLESLHIRSSQPESVSMQLFFGTVPEFFADHSIEVFIYGSTDLQENVPAKTTYQIQVGGLAG